MFPWVYGFEWNAGNVIFLGLFFAVIIVVGVTVSVAVLRSLDAFRKRTSHNIAWHAIFHDLPAQTRFCRHELTGEFDQRTCKRDFECRECRTHQGILATATGANPGPGDGTAAEGQKAVPGTVYFHRGHTWVRPEDDGTLTIGLDDLATSVVGSSAELELPKVGRRINQNGRAWRFRKGSGTVRVMAPVSGKILARGGQSEGWYLKVRPADGTLDLGHMLTGEEARAWQARESDRLLHLLPAECRNVRSEDGSMPADVLQCCGTVDWEEICGEMLLEA